MVLCFVCDAQIGRKRTQLCTRITSPTNGSYPEKIARLLGDEFVIIVNPTDYICQTCTTLLNHIDKLENDRKLVKDAMLSYVRKKYGLMPSKQTVQNVKTVNGQLKMKVPKECVPTVRENCVVTATVNTSVKTPLETIYKCGSCPFQSKELKNVRLHLNSHISKKKPLKDSEIQATVEDDVKPLTLVPQNKLLYKCQICSIRFESRIICLDHIKKNHGQPTSLISNEERETEDSCTVTAEILKPNQKNSMTWKYLMNINDNKQDEKKNTVHTGMSLNDIVFDGFTADTEQKKETERTGIKEAKTIKESKSIKKPEFAQEVVAEEKDDAAMSE